MVGIATTGVEIVWGAVVLVGLTVGVGTNIVGEGGTEVDVGRGNVAVGVLVKKAQPKRSMSMGK